MNRRAESTSWDFWSEEDAIRAWDEMEDETMRLLINSDMARMPRNCHECPLGMGTICFWMPADVDEDRPQEGRPEWCPLSEYKEPKRGRWIKEPDRERHWHCSECGHVVGMAGACAKYCPECGAKLETGT